MARVLEWLPEVGAGGRRLSQCRGSVPGVGAGGPRRASRPVCGDGSRLMATRPLGSARPDASGVRTLPTPRMTAPVGEFPESRGAELRLRRTRRRISVRRVVVGTDGSYIPERSARVGALPLVGRRERCPQPAQHRAPHARRYPHPHQFTHSGTFSTPAGPTPKHRPHRLFRHPTRDVGPASRSASSDPRRLTASPGPTRTGTLRGPPFFPAPTGRAPERTTPRPSGPHPERPATTPRPADPALRRGHAPTGGAPRRPGRPDDCRERRIRPPTQETPWF